MNALRHHARRGFLRLFREDTGQDLVEYALLTGIVALAAAIAIPAATALGTVYENWNQNIQNLWEAPPPGP